jgi:hypothetical protein
MRKWQIAALIILLAFIVAVAFGQDNKSVLPEGQAPVALPLRSPAKTPTLGAETHLNLVKDQNDIYRTALHMKDLESQYLAAQAQLKGQQEKFQNDLKNALTNSGLDPAKYEINAETFDVTPKPKVQ